MNSSDSLKVDCADAAVARSLESVLAPDNAVVPADQTFSVKRRSGTISFAVSSPKLRSPVTTIQGILADVALFREIWLISPGRRSHGRGS